ncbi:MAG: nitrate/nitrite transporter NrtS [Betaproteobacteria bacterium]|nr:nitrate/nitrite transporter NrtS [Betaproteobacteria bacterium]
MSMRPMGYWERFFRAMASPKIAGSGVKVSLVVGTLLNLVNQGEYLLDGQGLMVGHALLNYLVPFCVACYSGARALPIHASGRQAPRTENV